jgi:hypothetical protein
MEQLPLHRKNPSQQKLEADIITKSMEIHRNSLRPKLGSNKVGYLSTSSRSRSRSSLFIDIPLHHVELCFSGLENSRNWRISTKKSWKGHQEEYQIGGEKGEEGKIWELKIWVLKLEVES